MKNRLEEAAQQSKADALAMANAMSMKDIAFQTYAEGEEGQAVLDEVKLGIKDGLELLLREDINNHPALVEKIARLKTLREMEILLEKKVIFREEKNDAGN